MDDCYEVFKTTMDKMEEMRRFKERAMRQLRAFLNDEESSEDKENVISATQVKSGNSTSSTKRQRLSALKENEENGADKNIATSTVGGNNSEEVMRKRSSQRNKSRVSATIVEATSTTSHEQDIAHALESTSAPVNQTKSAMHLMPPPAAPVTATTSDQSFSRPQRAAKLNCEKHLKEPKLNSKLRREADGDVHIKLENEQRASQMHETTAQNQSKKKTIKSKSNASIASTASQDSVIVLPSKAPSIVTLTDQSDQSSVGNELENAPSKQSSNSTVQVTREVSVRIKREKISAIGVANQNKNKSKQVPKKETTTLIESSVFSMTTTLTENNTTSDTTQTKKSQRKKKAIPKPIKVERLSDEPKSQEDAAIVEQKDTTVYEEAVDSQQIDYKTVNNKATAINNETITVAQHKPNSFGASKIVTPNNATMVLGSAPNDATYCTAAASTFVIDPQNPSSAGTACSDLTFDVNTAPKDGTESQRSSNQSMATARDTLQPRADSLITEDESDPENSPAAKPINKPLLKMNTLPVSASKKAPLPPPKSYKMPAREIFNPLIQSPVKKKVEAFESVAAANKNTRSARSKLAKDNKSTNPSTTTPLIGKLPSTSAATASNRYLTPTQSMVTANAMGAVKKVTASASKALGLTKSYSADKIWTTSSAKAPPREHSAEDFRRGTSQLAEERKKQRDQRHLQAAQQREAKERERAERLAKAAKEREEKRLKKQKLTEQKQRELQEIQRKLKQQEEAQAAAAAAQIAAQKEKLAKINSGSAKARMLPPQPKTQYTFEMLHEDDSTDDEGKVTYKRPPPPTWSLSHVRGPQILAQEHVPKEIVDSFFSVQPRTLDLQIIFPKIDPRHLKRNSSAIWQTPPRYSELPKY